MDTRLRDVAQTLLANLATELEAAGLDVPERRYVASGDLVHDFAGAKCAEQFSIAWQGSFQGVVAPGGGGLINQAITCSMPLTAQFVVLLTRCVPVIDGQRLAPTQSALDESGRKLLLDAMTLAAVTVEQNVALLPNEFMQIAISNLQPVGPLGGVGGTIMTVLVGII